MQKFHKIILCFYTLLRTISRYLLLKLTLDNLLEKYNNNIFPTRVFFFMIELHK